MADGEEEEDHERQCQELLLKLKRTTESLLARQSVSGTWTTYGALRRIVADTENILSHRIREASATPGSEGSFWGFVQGLKWLCPSLAPMIDKVNRHSGAQKGGAVGGGGRSHPEAARAWLTDSVQDHSFLPQLDILVGNKEHLHSFYHDDAFLCQEDHVQAMRVCFRAIELNKPALLTDISPHLLRTSQASFKSGRRVSSALPSGLDIANGRARLTRTYSGRQIMGNRQPRLDVSYSGHLSRSNLSLTVDPSLGASSLLHQKSLSSPYFVSSLDSPRVLENLHGDIRDAIRSAGGGHASEMGSQALGGVRPHTSQVDQRAGHRRRTAASDHVGGAGSAPDLSLLAEPEVAVVSGMRRSTVVGSGSAQSALPPARESDAPGEEHLGGSDSTAYGSDSSGSTSTLSGFQDDGVPTSQRTKSLPADNTVTGESVPSSEGPRPKAFTDGQVCNHNSQDAFTGSGREAPAHTSNAYDASPDPFLSSPHRQHSVSIGHQSCSSETSIPSHNALPPLNISGAIDGPKGHKSQELDNHAAGQLSPTSPMSTLSQVSLGLDATSLNSILTCETDYGPDGVLFGFSPTGVQAGSPPETGPQADRRNHNYRASGLPEPGHSPTGTLAGTAAPGMSADLSHPTYSPDSGARPKLSSGRPEPLLTTNDPLLSPSPPMPTAPLRSNDSFNFPHVQSPPGGTFSTSPSAYPGLGMQYSGSEADLYCFSPPTSPLMGPGHGDEPLSRGQGSGSTKAVAVPVKLPGGVGSGGVFIPGRGMSLDRGFPGMSALATAQAKAGVTGAATARGGESGGGPVQASRVSLETKGSAAVSTGPGPASPRKGHKRWVSDTSVIQVDKLAATGTNDHQFVKAPDTGLYLSTMTKPAEGQSLISYLTSQDFNTCANLEKENAHFHIAEALISAFESVNWNRMMKKVTPTPSAKRSTSASTSSEEEEVTELRQRIRIRKREKLLERGRPFPSPSDRHSSAATTSYSASSIVSSSQDISSLSGGSSEGSASEEEDRPIDLRMSSSEAQGSLSALRSSGLSLSMASLYSEIELQKSNQQLERNSVTSGSTEEAGANQGSAEAVAISLLRRFSEKQLPKASELRWLVSERDAPQALLPLPASIPVSNEDGENSVLVQSSRQPRLRGNHEWAPPRAQIIFSVHPTEKRTAVMKRQNYRCAGCGLKVDPTYMKRYRYCEYLGKFFCQCCHTGETSAIIPGRVLERWDFARYPVSAFSHSLLDRMWQEPLFHVSTINPGLYKRVRALESIRECRRQLVHLHSLLVVCRRDARIIKELHKLPAHWVSNEDAYSMDDFTQVKSGVMLSLIKSFIGLAVAHIDSCPLCQGLGFICEMCNNPKVIFPFQLDSVVSCPVCQACYHKQCFVPNKCPKCIRMEARRKMRDAQLSPDSPDSSELPLRGSQTEQESWGADDMKGHSLASRDTDQISENVYGGR